MELLVAAQVARRSRASAQTIIGSTPASTSVASTPIAFDTGPVSANDSGVRPIETNQSSECARPRRSGGTREDMSVPQTTMPAVSRAPKTTAKAMNCHSAVPAASPTKATVENVHMP